MKVLDFFSQFANDPVTQSNLHKAVFGHGRLMTQRFGEVTIRPEIIDSLRRLPSPIVIGAHMRVGKEVIRVVEGDGSIRPCTFEVRTSPGYIGWAHRSGFAITASERTLHENKWVHWLRAQVDPDVPIFLHAHEDLWAFIEGCKPGAKFQVWENDNLMDVGVVENLMQYGFFARYLRRVAGMYPWPEGTWRLSDAMSEETLDTLGFLFFLGTTPEKMNGFGFALSDLKGDELPVKAWVPICMNLPRNGLVVWLLTEGHVLTHQDKDIGFKFGEILEREIEVPEKRFVKSPWPEIVVHQDIRTIPLPPPTEDVNKHSSDPSTWGCGIAFDFDNKSSGKT